MHRLIMAVGTSLLLCVGCGGKDKPAQSVTDQTGDASGDQGEATGAGEGSTSGEAAAKTNECVGFDIGNLEEILSKVACEEGDVNPDTLQNVDLKGKLEVVASASPTSVERGGKADLLVTFNNKSKDPLTLHFRIDPLPRFEVEVYDAKKSKRVDIPAGNPPPPPKGVEPPPPSDPKTARVTIAANGSARARIPWEAVKTKWAPQKVRGTPPERGYPRTPAGPLPKGKYVVKIITPLVGVLEGKGGEVSAPTVEVEIGK
jgi:hypothetical protein